MGKRKGYNEKRAQAELGVRAAFCLLTEWWFPRASLYNDNNTYMCFKHFPICVLYLHIKNYRITAIKKVCMTPFHWILVVSEKYLSLLRNCYFIVIYQKKKNFELEHLEVHLSFTDANICFYWLSIYMQNTFYSLSLIFTITLSGFHCYPHFINKETEA